MGLAEHTLGKLGPVQVSTEEERRASVWSSLRWKGQSWRPEAQRRAVQQLRLRMAWGRAGSPSGAGRRLQAPGAAILGGN